MCQVKRRSFLTLSATIFGGGLIASKTVHSLQNSGQGDPTGVYNQVHAVAVMNGNRQPLPRRAQLGPAG